MTGRPALTWRHAFEAAEPATQGDAAAIRCIREASAWSGAAQSFPSSISGQRFAAGFALICAAWSEASAERRGTIAPALIAAGAAGVQILDQIEARAADTWRSRADLA